MFYHLEKRYSFLLGIMLICLVGCSNRQQSSKDIHLSAGQELSQRIDEITNTFNKYPKEGKGKKTQIYVFRKDEDEDTQV